MKINAFNLKPYNNKLNKNPTFGMRKNPEYDFFQRTYPSKEVNNVLLIQLDDQAKHALLKTPSNISSGLSQLMAADKNLKKAGAQKLLLNPSNVEQYIKDLKNSPLNQKKITKLIAEGSSALVLQLEDGNVLKLLTHEHFPNNRPVESFDVPILERGKIGNTFYYIAPKAGTHDLRDEFVETVMKKIKKSGYKCHDINELAHCQIGFLNDGQVYLLDPECAIKSKLGTFRKIVTKLIKRFV